MELTYCACIKRKQQNKMADLEAVLADVSYLMAMEKSKCTPAARASKKIILPDPRYVSSRKLFGLATVYSEIHNLYLWSIITILGVLLNIQSCILIYMDIFTYSFSYDIYNIIIYTYIPIEYIQSKYIYINDSTIHKHFPPNLFHSQLISIFLFLTKINKTCMLVSYVFDYCFSMSVCRAHPPYEFRVTRS